MPCLDALPAAAGQGMVRPSARHVDGSMSALARDELLGWLKEEPPAGECRILCNVRVLSEGVDVPALDAVLFLSAKNSQVDVVQSVGRVMRAAPGKSCGWIVIPVLVPADVEPERALDDNERYKVVWSVLNALRAHDDRFNATVNKIELNRKKPDSILVGRPEHAFDGDVPVPASAEQEAACGPRQMALPFAELRNVVHARMVEKVGSRRYWEQWAKDVAEIAARQIERINFLIDSRPEQQAAFDSFLDGLRRSINPGIGRPQAVEMLAQRLVTGPVFEALFGDGAFVRRNAVSVAMQSMLDALHDDGLASSSHALRRFCESVRLRAKDVDNAEGRQRVVVELCDKFFRTAFPKMAEQLGIVYTPVEVVDFIVRSVDDVLRQEFGRSLSDENVHVLDPFAGTGTFIVRLLQSGLIRKEDLARKYRQEIHANEIVLLAYYIAAVNIEGAWHDLAGETAYTPFDGICLTDTFQTFEGGQHSLKGFFQENSERTERQKKAPIRVIIGNPPYSVGQKSANDNARNQKYEALDRRIAETYAKATGTSSQRTLYDSYFRAFRWSTDRLDEHGAGGVVAFVSNGSWLDGNSASGFRKCLEKEFSDVWALNLRGNQRTSGELSRKEGGKIFGSGSRTPVAIAILAKNPAAKSGKARIRYCDIGDYLTREEKLRAVRAFGSAGSGAVPWRTIEPNEHGDWISQRSSLFETFIPIEPEKKFASNSHSFFSLNSLGLNSNRDAWVYNSSKESVRNNIKSMIDCYNQQVEKIKQNDNQSCFLDFMEKNPKMISWSSSLVSFLERGKKAEFERDKISIAQYRPFFKQYIYYGEKMIHRIGQMNEIFPDAGMKNLVICVSAPGGNKDLSAIMTDCIPDLHLNGDVQCFPLYWHESREVPQMSLFRASQAGHVRHDGVTDFVLGQARQRYGRNVGKEDVFFYVYGLLHSPDYRAAFASDLKKMLPRLPLLDDPNDFWAFSRAGRKLSDLHVGYEAVPPCPGVEVDGAEHGLFRVEKMRFPAKDRKDAILFNSRITVSGIPAKAFQYVVNGKSAIEWVMERHQVAVHKESGIENDPNDWAEETGRPRFILDLLLSVINVGVQTVEIVEGLPRLAFEGMGGEAE